MPCLANVCRCALGKCLDVALCTHRFGCNSAFDAEFRLGLVCKCRWSDQEDQTSQTGGCEPDAPCSTAAFDGDQGVHGQKDSGFADTLATAMSGSLTEWREQPPTDAIPNPRFYSGTITILPKCSLAAIRSCAPRTSLNGKD